MNTSVFEELGTKAAEFLTVWKAIREGNTAAKEVIFGIKGRLAANREYRSDRLSEIERKLEDNTLSATMRKMLVQERDSLKTAEDAPTSIETAAFESAISQIEDALADSGKIRSQLQVTFKEAENELKKARSESLGNASYDPVRIGNVIDGLRKDFANLTR